MLQLKLIKSSKVKSPSSIEVSLEIRMLRRAAEEVGPEECLIFWRAFFDSFFGGQRKNGKLKKNTLPQLTLLTCDNDFGTLMALENIKNPSVILFRLDDFTPININKKLAIILKEIPQSQLLSGLFITVKEKNYRIRKLPMIL